MVEIIVPYGDPRHPFQHKCAFDVMDYGLGFTANSLELGCDCLGHIKYFDGMVNNAKGKALAFSCHAVIASWCSVIAACAPRHRSMAVHNPSWILEDWDVGKQCHTWLLVMSAFKLRETGGRNGSVLKS